MKPGDIIAYKINKNTTSWISKAISWVSRYTVGNWLSIDQDSFNHVAIMSDLQGYQYDVTWPNDSGLNLIEWDKYDVYSVEYQSLTEEQRERIINYCKANSPNKKYDWLTLLTFGLFKSKNKSICSKFVADAYLSAGIDLRKPNEYLISPNEIVYNKNMKIEMVYKSELK